MYVSSIRQLESTGRLRCRKTAVNTGNIFIAHRCTVEWSTKTPRSCIISSTCRRLSGLGHVPAHANGHDFKWVMKPLQDLVQDAVDQTLAEIKHGRNCRLCLLRQNRPTCANGSHSSKRADLLVVGSNFGSKSIRRYTRGTDRALCGHRHGVPSFAACLWPK